MRVSVVDEDAPPGTTLSNSRSRVLVETGSRLDPAGSKGNASCKLGSLGETASSDEVGGMQLATRRRARHRGRGYAGIWSRSRGRRTRGGDICSTDTWTASTTGRFTGRLVHLPNSKFWVMSIVEALGRHEGGWPPSAEVLAGVGGERVDTLTAVIDALQPEKGACACELLRE